MTHAIVARQAGGPEVLTYEDVERPVPGPGQLLVKVGAAGVNFIDTYKRSGTYKIPFPFTPGSEAAGTTALGRTRSPAHWPLCASGACWCLSAPPPDPFRPWIPSA